MKHLHVLVLSGAVLVLLSACHGSSYHGGGNGMSSSPPIAQGDAFITSVKSAVATAPDDAEPTSVDAIVATEADDKEPEAVM